MKAFRYGLKNTGHASQELKENSKEYPTCFSEPTKSDHNVQVYLSIVVWYNTLNHDNKVNKAVHREGIQLDTMDTDKCNIRWY